MFPQVPCDSCSFTRGKPILSMISLEIGSSSLITLATLFLLSLAALLISLAHYGSWYYTIQHFCTSFSFYFPLYFICSISTFPTYKLRLTLSLFSLDILADRNICSVFFLFRCQRVLNLPSWSLQGFIWVVSRFLRKFSFSLLSFNTFLRASYIVFLPAGGLKGSHGGCFAL